MFPAHSLAIESCDPVSGGDVLNTKIPPTERDSDPLKRNILAKMYTVFKILCELTFAGGAGGTKVTPVQPSPGKLLAISPWLTITNVEGIS